MFNCHIENGEKYNMALPKLNDTPKYHVVIPSTQNKVRYRPFLVKEEKVLMMALETKDQRKALEAIVDTIEACVTDEIDTKKLTTFDVEYMFTQIRSKSVGETSKINIKCEECNSSVEVEVPIDDVKIELPDVSNIVQLTNDISIKMKWPAYSEMTEFDVENPSLEDNFKMIGRCIESVQTAEENLSLKDESDEEVQAFLESLTSEQFKVIGEYMQQMPKLEHTLNYECSKCKTKKERKLSGIQDFF